MAKQWTVSSVCVCMVGLLAAGGAWADNLILSVPDWNQPNSYNPPGAGYPNWCCPAAAANIMGYWEDVRGCVGLTDQQAYAAGPAYPANAGTWMQGLFNDGQIEMGWHMDTGGWQTVPRPFPPNSGGTALANIGPGILSYANGAWVDATPPGPGTPLTKVAFPNTSVGIDVVWGPLTWANYVAEIDAGNPAVVTWDTWVSAPNGTTHTVNGQTVHEYVWGTTDPHCVTGLGYLDKNPAGFNQELTAGAGDEWVIAQDNWSTTPRYVAVPFVQLKWRQNDYVTDVPEPATMGLLGMGAVALLSRRRRR